MKDTKMCSTKKKKKNYLKIDKKIVCFLFLSQFFFTGFSGNIDHHLSKWCPFYIHE